MPIDVSRFVVPEQDFAGLYKVSDTIQQDRLMEERKQEVQRKEDEEKRGKTAASMRYFANYLDPKDRYTGTYYDPKMNEYLGEALGQAYDLARKGSGEAEILTAISPLVNKVNDYQQKAQMYSENKKQLLASLKGAKGYNTEYLGKYLDKEMFEGKDIDKVDPSDMLTALDNVYSKYGAEITNDDALDELIKTLPKSKVTTDIYFKNARGGSQRDKAVVDMPNIFVKDEEGGETKFVPAYDKATDFGEDIVADFVDDKGNKVQAPIRLLEENTFNQILRSSPAVHHRIGALVSQAIKSGKYTDANGEPITIDSPQAQNLARAILYDELKAKAGVDRSVIEQKRENPIFINNGKSENTIPIDLREQPDVGDGYKSITSMMGGIKTSVLPDGKSFIAEQVLYNPQTNKVKYIEYVNKDDVGKYGKPAWKEVSLTKFKQDVSTNNPGTDLKFLDRLKGAITDEPKPTQNVPTYKKTDLLKAGWTEDQIKKATGAGKIKVN